MLNHRLFDFPGTFKPYVYHKGIPWAYVYGLSTIGCNGDTAFYEMNEFIFGIKGLFSLNL